MNAVFYLSARYDNAAVVLCDDSICKLEYPTRRRGGDPGMYYRDRDQLLFFDANM
jgi:hypothetical protein